jgi:hypothetical protein
MEYKHLPPGVAPTEEDIEQLVNGDTQQVDWRGIFPPGQCEQREYPACVVDDLLGLKEEKELDFNDWQWAGLRVVLHDVFPLLGDSAIASMATLSSFHKLIELHAQIGSDMPLEMRHDKEMCEATAAELVEEIIEELRRSLREL